MAISSSTVFEVRTTGSDNNGGGFVTGASGTDYSRQNTAQVNIDNSTITTSITTTTVTFTGYTPTSNDIGNIVQFLSGTNVIVADSTHSGFYQITGQTSNTWTLDRTPLSSGTTTNATAKMGGALASLGSAVNGTVVGNIVFLLGPGTYTFTSTTRNVSGGPVSFPNSNTGGSNVNATRIVGYVTSRNVYNTDPIGSLPIIRAGTGIATGTYVYYKDTLVHIRNIIADNPNNTKAGYNGFQLDNGLGLCERCTADNFATGIWSSFGVNDIIDCKVSNCTDGFTGASNGGCLDFCYATGCTSHGFNISGNSTLSYCIADSNPGYGFYSTGSAFFNQCTSSNNTTLNGYGFYGADGCVYVNCVCWNNAQNDFDINIASWRARMFNCAGQTKGTNWTSNNNFGFITLTVSPFTSAAGLDFSLNATAGGGAACRGAGYPASYFGLSTTLSYFSLGAADPNPAGGGGGGGGSSTNVTVHRMGSLKAGYIA